MEETLVPMNFGDEKPKMKKSGSFGSDQDLKLDHQGEENTLDYRIAAKSAEGKNISLWHDISLVHIDPETGNETPFYNFVCEIPKFTRKSTKSPQMRISLLLNKTPRKECFVSSRREIFISTTDAFHKPGKILLSFILMQKVAEVTMTPSML